MIGTVAYDLFRVPFVMLGGYRLFAPIETYGLLLMDARASDAMTSFVGWSYHFLNGVGFAVSFALVARRRSLAAGVAFGLILETVALMSAFADYYESARRVDIVVISYLAHIPYGLALGHLAFAPAEPQARTSAHIIRIMLAPLLILSFWKHPWTNVSASTRSDSSIVIAQGRFDPQIVRVGTGDCLTVSNTDSVVAVVAGSPIPPLEKRAVCFEESGVDRVRLNGAPFSGGFVIVDPNG